jgi:U4/U6 small nuclear ribonucleoprotein PRP4
MDDEEVRKTLRKLGQPEELPDETPDFRASRLKSFLNSHSDSESPDDSPSNPDLLLSFRKSLCAFSLSQASFRLSQEISSSLPSPPQFHAVGSIFCDSRLPMSLSLDPSSSSFAVAGWSGDVNLYSLRGELLKTLCGHSDKVQTVDFSTGHLLSAGFDSSIRLWTHTATVFTGHFARVNTVRWHPFAGFFLSASHDMTWKLWDAGKNVCLMTQEGHNRGVYALCVQCDGSLAATGDLSGVAAAWDLRTGKHVLTLKGHLKGVYACEFAKNGYQVVTGSEDNTVKIWDLRKKAIMYTIPAHNKLVKAVAVSESCIASASYDGAVKVWSMKDFGLVQSLDHGCKVTSVCFDQSGEVLLSSNFDRTCKIWSKISMEKE